MDFSGTVVFFLLATILCTATFTQEEMQPPILTHAGIPVMNLTTLAVGENATFQCTGSESLRWRIYQATFELSETAKIQQYSRIGFIMTGADGPNGSYVLNMIVQVSSWMNNTDVQCSETSLESPLSSNTSFFFVLGAPSPPQPIVEVINTTVLQLSWLTPFTWPDHEIQNYTIRVENATEDMIYSRTITTVPNKTESAFLFDNIPQTCENLTFTVTATSDLGESGPATVSGRLLIAPGEFISETAILESGGAPVIQIQFEPPRMCPLQEFDYTILIHHVNSYASAEPFVIGPRNTFYSEGLAVNETADVDLAENAVYSVTVKITTQVGSPSFSTNDITLFSSGNLPTRDTITGPANDSRDPPTTDATIPETSTEKSSTTDSLVMKIGIGLGGAIIVTLLLLGVLTVTVVLFTRTLRQDRIAKKAAEKACSGMVQNPIYDGPVYEMIQPQFSSLPSSCTVATNELRYLDNPTQPSIANGSIKQQDSTSTEDTTKAILVPEGAVSMPQSEDNYTVMSPVSVLGYSFPEDGVYENKDNLASS